MEPETDPHRKKKTKGNKDIGRISADVNETHEDVEKTRRNELEREKKAAFLGFVRVDLLEEGKFTFGRWNDRNVEQDMVTKLAASFERGTIQRYEERNALMIPVATEKIIKEKIIKTLDNEKILPMLSDIFVEGHAPAVVRPCGGQHRTRALKFVHEHNLKLVSKLALQVEELNNELTALVKVQESGSAVDGEGWQWDSDEGGRVRSTRIVELREILVQLEGNIRQKKRDIKLGGLWLAAVYDIGEQSQCYLCERRIKNGEMITDKLSESGLLLMSKNDSNFVFMETKDEWMFGHLRSVHSLWAAMKYAPLVAAEVQKERGGAFAEVVESEVGMKNYEKQIKHGQEQAKSRGVTAQHLLKMPHTREMLMRLLGYGPYFRQLKDWMTTLWMSRNMFNVSGGVCKFVSLWLEVTRS